MAKNGFKILLISFLILSIVILGTCDVYAQKKKKKSGEEDPQKLEEELKKSLEEIEPDISSLTKKVYASMLFSPSDNDKMVELKSKLIKMFDKNSTSKLLASPMYDLGYVHKSREYYDDAEELFNSVIEKHPDTTYGKKAQKELVKLEEMKQKQTKKAEAALGSKKKG